MNRFLLLAGLLLISLLPGQAVHAEENTIDCKQIVDSPTPVSDYTKKVMKRVKEGLENDAQTPSGGEENQAAIVNMVRYAGAVIVSSIDTSLRIISQQKSLRERTTCEQYDVTLLECKMEDIRDKINEALGDNNYAKAYRLQALYAFINQRIRALLLGSRNQQYTDATWGERQSFDPSGQVWCCVSDGYQCKKISSEDCTGEDSPFQTVQACEASGCNPPDEPDDDSKLMCPFSTDYFPPATDQLGCDEEVLKRISNYPPAEKEREQLKEIKKKVAEYREKSQSLLTLEKKIKKLLGLPVPPDPEESSSSSSSSSQSSRRAIEGCLEGECSNDKSKTCSVNSDCGEGNTCNTGWKACKEKPTQFCDTDDECGDNGPCSIQDPPAYLAWEARGRFSAVRDEPTLLTIFSNQRMREPREFPDDLKLAFERSSSSSASSQADGYSILDPFRLLFRTSLEKFSISQARDEAAYFAQGADPIYQTADALASVREASQPVMQLAGEKTGLRALVIHFAWFLRRTCIDFPCNARLEDILRIANTDDCYPFVSGTYVKQTCNDPQWKKCVDGAKLDIKAPELDCNE